MIMAGIGKWSFPVMRQASQPNKPAPNWAKKKTANTVQLIFRHLADCFWSWSFVKRNAAYNPKIKISIQPHPGRKRPSNNMGISTFHSTTANRLIVAMNGIADNFKKDDLKFLNID